ncbi:hypothetical protein [Nocardia jinanensis]|uniref:Mce-associated membrane protein n=1 Tax=Nocardia jinanensis TaxID=382504 RepID=A0A917R4G4_9NOCA|nr:hypothetical protein [Nocardia jinanensis]GGK90194.1 hypothetical protein GCM10011588_00530 [Nocardia jinanensis]
MRDASETVPGHHTADSTAVAGEQWESGEPKRDGRSGPGGQRELDEQRASASWTTVGAWGLAALALVTLSALLGWRWYSAESELDALRSRITDRDRVAAVAADYAKRSLTYDFRSLDTYFAGVQHGTTAGLSHRYDTVRATLTEVMTEAEVIAQGDIVGTAVDAVDGDNYIVTVFATQQTRNARHAEPVGAATLVTVDVQRAGDEWLVADYRPR